MLATGLTLAATGLVMAAGPAAQAELRAPYARAAAIVESDGTLTNGKNVTRSWRLGVGRYCVQVARGVDVTGSLMQVGSRQALRLPHVVYGSAAPVTRQPSPGHRHGSPVYRDPTPGQRHVAPGHSHVPPGHRNPSPVYGSPWATCGGYNTVGVNVYNPGTGRLADGSFDLVIA
ncbi:hypothetical protein ACQEVF_02240 [Nonomuraea polychroma]|uniref:hypothetical protein n=1 Tax=Nonomuraea polychroma TaxID=46176 RepID=UPI003D8C6430